MLKRNKEKSDSVAGTERNLERTLITLVSEALKWADKVIDMVVGFLKGLCSWRCGGESTVVVKANVECPSVFIPCHEAQLPKTFQV
jgi:hypothetical protein